MTIISFLKKFDELINNYDYYMQLAKNNREEFYRHLVVPYDNKSYSEKEIRKFQYILTITYAKLYGIKGSYQKIEDLFYLLPDNNSNNILLKSASWRILYSLEKLYKSFIGQKLFLLIKNAKEELTLAEIKKIEVYLNDEKDLAFLLGIEEEQQGLQLSIFKDLEETNETNKYDDTLMENRMVRARLHFLQYINNLGICEYDRRRDYIIKLIYENDLCISESYKRMLLLCFDDIDKERRNGTKLARKKIKKESMKLII